MSDYLLETEEDRCIRKFSVINLFVLFLLLCIYKIFAVIGFGYFTFRNIERPNCYADATTTIPKSQRENV